MIVTTQDVKLWAENRLIVHREKLEVISVTESDSIILRGRIAECKVLLEALKNEVPPVWNDTTEV